MKELDKQLSLQLTKLGETYRNTNWQTHLQRSMSLIRYMNKIPSVYLSHVEKTFEDQISKFGLEPYLSIIIELAYRFNNRPTLVTLDAYNSLMVTVRKKTLKIESKAPALLRKNRKGDFIITSANVAKVVSQFEFSKLGKRQFDFGFMPGDFVVVASQYQQCSHNTENINTSSDTSGRRLTSCMLLGQQLQQDLGEKGMDDFNAGIQDIELNGFYGLTEDCKTNLMESSSKSIVDDIESMVECKSKDAVKGKNETLSSENTLFTVKGNVINTRSLMQSMSSELAGEYPYISTWEEDGISFTRWSSDKSDNIWSHEQRGENSYDSFTSTYYEGDGNYRSAGIYQVNGRTMKDTWKQTSSDGSSVSIRTQNWGNGKTRSQKITITNADGSTVTIESKYNEDGSPAGTTVDTSSDAAGEGADSENPGETVSQQLENSNVSPCTKALTEDLRNRMNNEITKLQTQIIPNPDAPVESDFNACNTSTTTKKCLSVALCIDPALGNEQCSCGESGTLTRMDANHPGYDIDCGPESSYDPSTGTCRRTGINGMGQYAPGIMNPDFLTNGFKRMIEFAKTMNSRVHSIP